MRHPGRQAAVGGNRGTGGHHLAPGGLLGGGLAHLAEANTSTVLIAVAEVAEGRYIKPDWADH